MDHKKSWYYFYIYSNSFIYSIRWKKERLIRIIDGLVIHSKIRTCFLKVVMISCLVLVLLIGIKANQPWSMCEKISILYRFENWYLRRWFDVSYTWKYIHCFFVKVLYIIIRPTQKMTGHILQNNNNTIVKSE